MVFSRGPLAQRQGPPFLCPYFAKTAAVMQEKFVIISVFHCRTVAVVSNLKRLNAEGEARVLLAGG